MLAVSLSRLRLSRGGKRTIRSRLANDVLAALDHVTRIRSILLLVGTRSSLARVVDATVGSCHGASTLESAPGWTGSSRMDNSLWAAFVLGGAAGLSPGPLLALVTFESMSKGFGAGVKVAVTPLFTDGLIAVLSIIAFGRLTDTRAIVAAISFSGAVYLLYLAVKYVKTYPSKASTGSSSMLRRSMIVNLLNPSPYIFWITVAGPLIYKTSSVDILTPLEFVIGFYCGLIGSKIGFAKVASIADPSTVTRWYSHLKWGLALLLVAFAVTLFSRGLFLARA
jgi:threonine/homoserine/homoserine lactone efflux protein